MGVLFYTLLPPPPSCASLIFLFTSCLQHVLKIVLESIMSQSFSNYTLEKYALKYFLILQIRGCCKLIVYTCFMFDFQINIMNVTENTKIFSIVQNNLFSHWQMWFFAVKKVFDLSTRSQLKFWFYPSFIQTHPCHMKELSPKIFFTEKKNQNCK